VAKNTETFAVNERVNHGTYGLGTIKEVGPAHTTIEFDEQGRRKFVTSIVQLERSTVAAPASTAKRARSKKPSPKPGK
jgi:hypothetical protein